MGGWGGGRRLLDGVSMGGWGIGVWGGTLSGDGDGVLEVRG